MLVQHGCTRNSICLGKNGRRNSAAGEQISCTTPLIIPEIKGIPKYVYPEFDDVPEKDIRKIAKLVLALDPACSLRWKIGTSKGQIVGDILRYTEKAFSKIAASKRHVFSPAISISEECFVFYLELFEWDVNPIYYNDFLVLLSEARPIYTEMAKQAMALFGSLASTPTWVDVKSWAEDYYQMYLGDFEELKDSDGYKEEYEDAKALSEEIKKVGSEGIFFIKRGHLKAELYKLQKLIKKARPKSLLERLTREWCGYIADLFIYKGKAAIPAIENLIQDTEMDSGECLPLGFSYPVLFSQNDAVDRYYQDYIDESINSGAYFHHMVFLSVEFDKVGPGILPSLMKDIEVSGKLCRIIDFYNRHLRDFHENLKK